MKHKLYCLIVATTLSFTYSHRALSAIGGSACTANTLCLRNCDIIAGNEARCQHSTTTYYSGGGLSGNEYGGVISCTACRPGATRSQASIRLASDCTATYYICTCSCSTTDWTAGNTGYEQRTVCNTTTCATTTEYRCAAGYYGTPTNGTSGCTRCPSSGGAYGTTAGAGATAPAACYIPAGAAFSDGTGSGTYTGNCYY